MAVYDYTSSVTMVMVALEDGNIDGAVEVFKEDRTSFATFCIGVYPGFLFNEIFVWRESGACNCRGGEVK